MPRLGQLLATFYDLLSVFYLRQMTIYYSTCYYKLKSLILIQLINHKCPHMCLHDCILVSSVTFKLFSWNACFIKRLQKTIECQIVCSCSRICINCITKVTIIDFEVFLLLVQNPSVLVSILLSMLKHREKAQYWNLQTWLKGVESVNTKSSCHTDKTYLQLFQKIDAF